MSERKTSKIRDQGKNALEWTVFGLSCLLVISMIAVLAVAAAGWQDQPPALSAKLGEPEIKERLVTVVVEVTNHGDIAASEVKVEVTRTAGGIGHQASVMLDFVPRHGTRRGQVSFPDAAETGDIRITGVGFAEP
ncbi:hypothetical protein OKA05_19390 [Luteolibacter arcticus]|uniref:TIGR02588 family protein n=1 Tax=Luteolibacter arcticus TaxID=1581411 RepID=A0ABT3GMK4_9BACT|nr:hypothetical protein [Luteolibacter arcticus]MCW1924738.1 hypothetical protein [Luteolibacter arcticus]